MQDNALEVIMNGRSEMSTVHGVPAIILNKTVMATLSSEENWL